MRLVNLVLGLMLLPAVGAAQTRPILTISPIPQQFLRMNCDHVDTNAQIELTWLADTSFGQSYRYELSYDVSRSPEQPNVTLVTLDDTVDAGENMGTVISGAGVTFRIRPQQILRAEELCDVAAVDTNDQPQTRSIILQVYVPGQEGSEQSAASAAWNFEYDSQRPPPPRVRAVAPGESRVIVSWDAADPVADVETYEIVYCPNGTGAMPIATATTATVGIDIAGLPCSEREREVQSADVNIGTLPVSDNVTNGIPVAVAMRSVDEFGNKGELSNAILQTPAPTTDFWELYRGEGGTEDGGFCFVATAAHGSYAHPVVRVLRTFRDLMLLRSSWGTGLVWAYYRWSPPAAELIRNDAAAASLARLALIPIALLALFIMALPLIGAAALLWVFGRRRFMAGAAVVALSLTAMPAEASELRRPDASGYVGFGFEFKGGPYLPDLAKDTSNLAFSTIFGGQGSNPLFGLAVDLQLYRGFGTAGVGGSFGFMQFVGKGVFGNSKTRSLDTTVFNIMPLNLVAFYRFDWVADRWPVPLVPYVRGGLAYYVWWVTNGNGNVARDASDNAGRGGKFGVTGTLGMALMLNHLEPQAARGLYNTTGIRGTYLFGEITGSKVDGFGGDGFDFSEMTWNLGMYVEF